MTTNNFIEIEYIAKTLEALLGENFVVCVDSVLYRYDANGNIKPEYQGKHVGVLKTERVPFAIEGSDSETVNISLEFYETTNNDAQKKEMNDALAKISGTTRGIIAVGDKAYTYTCYLQKARPFQPPGVSMGDFKSAYTINGTMLISSPVGAIMSNDIKTFIGETELKTLEVTTEYTKGVESPVKLNNSNPSVVPQSESTAIALLFLYERNAVCAEIAARIAQKDASTGISDVYEIRREFPDGTTVIHSYAFLDGRIIEKAGAYSQIQINLRAVI
jgi:hypothetical protein